MGLRPLHRFLRIFSQLGVELKKIVLLSQAVQEDITSMLLKAVKDNSQISVLSVTFREKYTHRVTKFEWIWKKQVHAGMLGVGHHPHTWASYVIIKVGLLIFSLLSTLCLWQISSLVAWILLLSKDLVSLSELIITWINDIPDSPSYSLLTVCNK